MNDGKRVASNILVFMGARDLTQPQLAKSAGIHENTLANYIRGRCEPGAFKLKRIADSLGCTVDDLLKGVGE